MNDIELFALATVVRAHVMGMESANLTREHNGFAPAYGDEPWPELTALESELKQRGIVQEEGKGGAEQEEEHR